MYLFPQQKYLWEQGQIITRKPYGVVVVVIVVMVEGEEKEEEDKEEEDYLCRLLTIP